MSKGVALCLAVILKVSVLSNLNEMLQKRSYKEDTDMLKKSLFSYHKLLNNTLYLYNSLKGSNSLTKITNPDMINWINKMINSGNYYDGNSNIIQLLQEIEFIKDISIKEEKKQRRLKRIQIETSADLFLTIMPTTNCNFRCAYCYEEYEPKIMSEITQQNLINFVVKKLNRCRNLFVNWFGGEPLLAIDTIKSLSSEFIKITHALKKGYLASMTTNGYLLTPETVKDFLRYKIVDYQITLDGIEITHDVLRKHKTGQSTYKVILNNLIEIKKNIKSSVLNITIRTNYTKNIYDKIQEYYEVMKELECKNFNFSIKMASNWGGDRVTRVQDKLLQISNYPQILKFFNTNSPKPDFSSHMHFFDSQTSICGAAKTNSYIINSDGSIYKCTVDFSKSYGSVHDINNINFEDIYYKSSSIDSTCDNCFFSGCCLDALCPKAKKEQESLCPPEKLYIDDFLMLMPDKCFRIIQ